MGSIPGINFLKMKNIRPPIKIAIPPKYRTARNSNILMASPF
jgi:hypothetical protein